MHIRIRNKVAQLIRTTYDKDSKKGRNVIVGKVKLNNPVLDESLRKELTDAEIVGFDKWVRQQQRVRLLREEIAALTLVDQMSEAGRWFAREGDTPQSRAVATAILANWQDLRRTLRKGGLVE